VGKRTLIERALPETPSPHAGNQPTSRLEHGGDEHHAGAAQFLLEAYRGRGWSQADAPGRAGRQSMRNGSVRSRLPVAAKIAFATAGAIGGVPGSPTPPGAAPLATISTSIRGASSIRITG
jgi:hypothetical protein